MALPSTRMEFRVALSHVDREIEAAPTLIVAHHPSETFEHLVLRVLACCLFYEDRIEFGPGLSDPEAADLWARDLTGRLTLWVECGAADAEKLRRVVQHNAGAKVHALFAGDKRRRELGEQIAGMQRGGRALAQVELWTAPAELVAALAAREDRRRRWSVTIVGDHLYVEEDGVTVDGPLQREMAAAG